MITLDDFEKFENNFYVSRRGGEDGPWVHVDKSTPSGYYWNIADDRGYYLENFNTFPTPQIALDDLLACDNPVAVRALKAVFGDKYEEPTP